jgi:hypothetical protein
LIHVAERETKVAFLVARGNIGSITDKAGLERHEAELGVTSDEKLQELQVRLDWGREKEPFALRAMRNTAAQLPEFARFFADTYLMETGFTSCGGGCVS